MSPITEDNGRNNRRILWWGPAESEYGWLKDRISKYRSQFTAKTELHTIESDFEEVCEFLQGGRVDRVVVACQNRWDYPRLRLEQLSRDFPEVPIALAVGDWWLGWRRTGIGHLQNLPHLSLPWFRWWDGWIPWFDGMTPAMFGPMPLERVAAPAQVYTRPTQLPELNGTTAKIASEQQVEWISWDDSQLATWLGWEKSMQGAIEELTAIQTSNPRARIWITWTLPTWEVVSRLNRAGLNFELIAKPYVLSLFGEGPSLSSAALARP